MKFSQSFMDEIRGRVRMSELVGRSIPLRRAGREYHALCPFHKEKTPSFTINDEKGFYHCFGCGAHGDVIGFVMEYEHLKYPEAVEKLAGIAGLSMPRESLAEVASRNQSESLQQVVEACAGWFESQMETGEGELARRYLLERGLHPETIARFRLGYAPTDRDALKKAMLAQGISEAQLRETGMLIAVDGRAPYSRFRRRLIFPIRDRKSRVIAFGGRVLPGEPNHEAPKYLNSPETPLFHKGRQLFNLDLARRAAFDARQLIVCEGYMDVIALAQAGVAHAVAPLGTAITPEQLQLCWQIVDEPTLCLDGDNAGQRAMTRATELALPLLVPGKTLRVAVMPRGEDPDSLIRSIGRQAFDETIARAQPLVSVLWQQIMGSPATTPEARAAQEQQIMQRVQQIKHPSVQHYYKQHVKDQLRAAQQATYAKAQSGRASFVPGQKRRFVPATHAVAVPPIARTADTSLLIPASNLMALVIACPSLLSSMQAEEFWLHAPMPAPWQQQVHHLISELHIASPQLTSTLVWQSLQEEVAPESLAALAKALEGLSIRLDADDITREGRAQRLWGEVVNDVARARLRAECVEAEAVLASDLTEENFERLTQLKAQLESLERERSRFYREDPMTGTS
jgi:DNA primase